MSGNGFAQNLPLWQDAKREISLFWTFPTWHVCICSLILCTGFFPVLCDIFWYIFGIIKKNINYKYKYYYQHFIPVCLLLHCPQFRLFKTAHFTWTNMLRFLVLPFTTLEVSNNLGIFAILWHKEDTICHWRFIFITNPSWIRKKNLGDLKSKVHE